MSDPFWSVVISAIIPAIVGGMAGGLAGYYSAKRVAIDTETRAEIDLLREEALRQSDIALERADKVMQSTSNWTFEKGRPPIPGLSLSRQTTPKHNVIEAIESASNQLGVSSSKINSLMPKNPEVEPYYHDKMQARLAGLEEKRKELEELKIKVQQYPD